MKVQHRLSSRITGRRTGAEVAEASAEIPENFIVDIMLPGTRDPEQAAGVVALGHSFCHLIFFLLPVKEESSEWRDSQRPAM
ncbi:hypothetical protein F9222_23505 [Escherichia coli]|nr:hypothetical protein F9222_23505 [Escherichia coli]